MAAGRIYDDIVNGRRRGEVATTLMEASAKIQEQTQGTMSRYFSNYGIDIGNTNPFHIVIDTEKKTPVEVVALIREHYRKWQASGRGPAGS